MNRSVAALLLGAAMFATGTGFVHAAETPGAIDGAAAVERADALLAEGQTIHARAILLSLTQSGDSLSLTDAERARASEMLQTANRRMRQMDGVEQTIQKAEFALRTDDLVAAEQQAMSVLSDANATNESKRRAHRVVQDAGMRRAMLAASVGADVDAAVELFRQGDYARAKAGFERITQTGVTLDARRARTVEQYRTRIIDLEFARGTAFSAPIAMSLFEDRGDEATPSWLLDQPEGDRSGSYVIEDVPTSGAPARETPPATSSTTGNTALLASTSLNSSEQPDVDVIEAARRFEAKSLMGEADLAFEERRLNESLNKYNRAISQYGQYLDAADIQRARDRIAEIEVQIQAQGGPSGGIDEVIGERGLVRDRVLATYNNLLGQADTALAEGDTTRARDFIAQARLELNRGRSVLAEPEFESMQETIEERISAINTAEEELRRTEAATQAEVLERETREARIAQLQRRDQKINEAIERVRSLQQELKYEEALEVVDQILFLDPINPAGLLLKDVIEDTIIYRDYRDVQRAKGYSWAEQTNENHRAMIAPPDLVNYPEDWPAISFRRGSPLDLNETPADRSAMAALRENSGPVMYDDNFLVDVIANITTRASVDIDVDWNSLEDIGIDQETPVSLRLSGAAWSTVLDRVLDKVSEPDLPASWSVQDGILTIASKDVLDQRTTLAIYDINDLLFEVPYFDNAPEFDLNTVLQSSGGGGGGQSPFGGGNNQNDDRENREERIQQIIDLVQNSIDPDGWVDLGGNTGTIQELNGNLIVTQTPRSHREIVGLLDQLRQIRSLQINVEARFLLVNEDFFEQIGFDLDVYLNSNNQFNVLQGLDPSLTLDDFFDDNGQLLPNVTGGGIFPVDTDGDGIADTLSTITSPVFAPNAAGDEFSVIRGAQNSFGITSGLTSAASGFAQEILNSNPALGITGRFLDDIQVDFLLEATQADRRTVTLTAPRLTFMNGQRAFIAVATQQTFVSDLTPVVSDSSVAFDPVISTISSGVVLDVEGVISSDRRYVTMTVLTSISEFEFDSDRNITLTGGAGGTGGSTGAGGAEAFVQVPVTQATTLNTTVTVPDQGTVLLGGQRVVNEVEIETGVPVLSKIPVLNRFFSNRSDVKEEQTVMVLIKPTILIQDEEEEKNFPGLLDQLGG
ncbi:MAG: hypothetical protein RIB60_07915 [Phycisphaerales bacterium]